MTSKYPETLKEVRKLFGINLKRIRLEKDLFQREVAEAFGVNTTYIHAMEKGKNSPSLRNFCVLSNCLGVSMEEFFKGISKIPLKNYRKKNGQ